MRGDVALAWHGWSGMLQSLTNWLDMAEGKSNQYAERARHPLVAWRNDVTRVVMGRLWYGYGARSTILPGSRDAVSRAV
jgi:hypothetical protein